MERSSGLAAALKAMALMAIGGIAAMATARTRQPEPKPLPATAPASASLPAPTGPLVMTNSFHPGLWEVRFTDGGGEIVRRLCLADLSPLLQIRHQRPGCGRLVLTNDAAAATVQYSCPGAGWGRTSLRAIGRDTVRLETQGVADNAPFAFSAVARRNGDCAAIAQAH